MTTFLKLCVLFALVAVALAAFGQSSLPPRPAALVNSNGTLFILTSGLGSAWTGTNKIAP